MYTALIILCFFCVQTNHFLCIKKVNLEATVVIILSAAVFAGPW